MQRLFSASFSSPRHSRCVATSRRQQPRNAAWADDQNIVVPGRGVPLVPGTTEGKSGAHARPGRKPRAPSSFKNMEHLRSPQAGARAAPGKGKVKANTVPQQSRKVNTVSEHKVSGVRSSRGQICPFSVFGVAPGPPSSVPCSIPLTGARLALFAQTSSTFHASARCTSAAKLRPLGGAQITATTARLLKCIAGMSAPMDKRQIGSTWHQ